MVEDDKGLCLHIVVGDLPEERLHSWRIEQETDKSPRQSHPYSSQVRERPAPRQREVGMRGSRVASKIGVVLVTGGLFAALTGGAALAQASPNGASTQRPVFYEGRQVTVNMFEVSASDPLLANNKGVNTIYATNDLDEEQDFLSVIDAVPGDGMNPLWHQVLIVFNAGVTPHQFTSEDEVLAAAAGPHPEITLVSTDEVYRCSIVGSK